MLMQTARINQSDTGGAFGAVSASMDKTDKQSWFPNDFLLPKQALTTKRAIQLLSRCISFRGDQLRDGEYLYCGTSTVCDTLASCAIATCACPGFTFSRSHRELIPARSRSDGSAAPVLLFDIIISLALHIYDVCSNFHFSSVPPRFSSHPPIILKKTPSWRQRS
jgi:hypothetical protein